MNEEKRPLLIQLPITVKTYDIDFANIVHNMVYIRWLEDLRLQMLEDTYSVATMFKEGIGPILTRTELDHLWPTRYGDEVVDCFANICHCFDGRGYSGVYFHRNQSLHITILYHANYLC
jgi:hypothetical protein